ncbi:DUF1566 domain-containing protein [Pseudomonadales bacterium]|nr:DUF1566 domain-containing protein [Pseudomonadales bacterium]
MANLLRLVACLFVVVVSSSSHAALYDRGNGLIYDDVLNITWMQDANYAQTSGYAAANASGFFNYGYSNIQADGGMGWDAANTWAAQLEYGGFDSWGLPSAQLMDATNPCDANDGSCDAGFNNVTGELAHMFYTNLGNAAGDSILNNVSFTDAALGGGIETFSNVQGYTYWLSDQYEPKDGDAWAFGGSQGYQGSSNKDRSYYSWAVHDGDIGAAVIPIPTTAWLFGSALAGLLVAKRKNKK